VALHNRRLHKIAKSWLPLSAKFPHWLNPLYPCSCGHTMKFKKSELFAPKSVVVRISRTPSPHPLSAKCPHWTNSLPLSADVFYGQHLIIFCFWGSMAECFVCGKTWSSYVRSFKSDIGTNGLQFNHCLRDCPCQETEKWRFAVF